MQSHETAAKEVGRYHELTPQWRSLMQRIRQFDRAERLIREQLSASGGRYQVLRVESATVPLQKALVINHAYAIPHLGIRAIQCTVMRAVHAINLRLSAEAELFLDQQRVQQRRRQRDSTIKKAPVAILRFRVFDEAAMGPVAKVGGQQEQASQHLTPRFSMNP